MKTHTTAFKNNINRFGRELDSKITYTLNNEEIELGPEELNSVSPHYEGATLKSVMKQLDIDSNVEIPVGTILNYKFGVKVRDKNVLDYRDNYDYIEYGNYIVYSVEKQEDTNSYNIVCYDKMLYAMKEYENSDITFPLVVDSYIMKICNKIGVQYQIPSSTYPNYDKMITDEYFLDNEGRSMGYTFRDVLDQLAEVTASTICINKYDKLELRYIDDTEDTIGEDYLKDVNVKFGKKFGPVNTIILSRGGDGDKISLSNPVDLPDSQKIAIQITDNQIMNGNDRDTYMSAILNKLYGLEYYINDYSSTGICYYDLCDMYNISIDGNTYSCIMLNDEVNITQGLEENVYTEMPDESEQEYKYMNSTDRGITQANIIAKKNEATITEYTQKLDETNNRLNSVETKQTETDRTISIISTNIDSVTGEVNAVTTREKKFTFNDSGLNISTSDNTFKSKIDEQGVFFEDGTSRVAEYTKDGSKQKDLHLFGVYYYGMEDINDTPMFVAQLYTDESGNECFGHFYNRGN